jgi:hypothetical protein
MKSKFSRWSWLTLVMAAIFLALPHLALAAGPTVLTVPTDPNNPTFPHNTYNICSDGTIPNYTSTPPTCTLPATLSEITIGLGATVPSASGSTDSFSVTWSFGDGSANVTLPTFTGTSTSAPYAYDISTTHQYPISAAVGTAWTATVTVTDTTNSTSASANYYVIQEQDNLNSRVNVAIDNGLWYMHETMWRLNGTPNTGGWDSGGSCHNVGGAAYDCSGYGVQDAENVQAFEVSGHLQTGPGSDPYTDDVARGLARMLQFLVTQANASVTYGYNPATANYTCADGTVPTTTDPTCTGATHTVKGEHFYNPGATSCTSPPCAVTYDGNANGQMIYDNSGESIYTTAPYLDALVASGTPAATAPTGGAGIKGATFKNIIQDILDYYGYSQYGSDPDVNIGYTRGGNYSAQGGAWLYSPQEGDDDSTSQWAAIAFISGQRGSGINIPASVTDFNNVWVTNAQDVGDPAPASAGDFCDNSSCSGLTGDTRGAYGYRGSFQYSNAWGPFAVTPSGLVQMALDGVGRTKNTAFGDATTDFDQRWNTTETFYADNFCNSTASADGGAYYTPRLYLYGLYSFTKAMLLHDPNGSLAPIQYLRTQTPGVFSNPSDPPNSIDWYAALSSANGGSDACDGVAQDLVNLQASDGHWYGNSYSGSQWTFETPWAIIMLRRTVFVSCINNLYGRGTPGNVLAKPRVDLTWSAQTNATSYNILRGTVSGGPYTLVGSSTIDSFSDRTAGLTNGGTYYYVAQPVNNGNEICQSNEEKVVIP